MRQNLIDISVAVLGRSPSPQELTAWMEDAENGQTLGELTSLLLLSQEGQDRFPDTGTNADYLTNAYQQLFGRAPDADGLAYWENQLEAGNVDFTTLVAVLVEGARAETGNPNDAAVVNARTDAAESYLSSVESGDVEFDADAAKNVVTAVERDDVANPDLEPDLPDDGENPPGDGDGDPTPPGDGGGDNGGDPTPQPDPEATFEVAQNGVQEFVTGEPATPSTATVTTTWGNFQTAGVVTLQVAGLNDGEPIDIRSETDLQSALNEFDENNNFSVEVTQNGEPVNDPATLNDEDEIALAITDAAGRAIESVDLRAASAGELSIELTDEEAASVNGTNLVIDGSPLDTSAIDFSSVTSGAELATELAALSAITSANFANDELTIATAEGAAIAIDGESALLAPASVEKTVDTPVEANGTDGEVAPFSASFTVDDLDQVAENDTLALVIGDKTYTFAADNAGEFDSTAPMVTGGDDAADPNLAFDIDKATGEVVVTNDADDFQVASYTTDVAARAGETEQTVDTAVNAEGSSGEVAPFEATFTVADLDQTAENDSLAVEIDSKTYTFVANQAGAFDAAAPVVTGGDEVADPNLAFSIDNATGAISVTNDTEDFQVASYTTDVAARAGETEETVAVPVEADGAAGEIAPFVATFNVADLDQAAENDSLALEVDGKTYTFTADQSGAFDAESPVVTGGDGIADPNLAFAIDKATGDISATNDTEDFQVASYTTEIASRVEPVETVNTAVEANGAQAEVAPFEATFTVADLDQAAENDSLAVEIDSKTYTFVANQAGAFDAAAPTVTGGDEVADPNLSFSIDNATGAISVTNDTEDFQVASYTTDVAARASETEETVAVPVEADGAAGEIAPFVATFNVADLDQAVENDSLALEVDGKTYTFAADQSGAFDAESPVVTGGDETADPNLAFNIDKATGEITVTNDADDFQVASYTTVVAARAGETEQTVGTAVEAQGSSGEVAPFAATFTVDDLGQVAANDSLSLDIDGKTYSFVADETGSFDAAAPEVSGGDNTADPDLAFDIDKATGEVTVTHQNEDFTVASYTSEIVARSETSVGAGIDGTPGFAASETILADGDVAIDNGSEAVDASSWSAVFDLADFEAGESYNFDLSLTEEAVEGDTGGELETFTLLDDFSVDVAEDTSIDDITGALVAEINGLEGDSLVPFEASVDDGQLSVTADQPEINYSVTTDVVEIA